jgi:hypothetical protein
VLVDNLVLETGDRCHRSAQSEGSSR